MSSPDVLRSAGKDVLLWVITGVGLGNVRSPFCSVDETKYKIMNIYKDMYIQYTD